MGGGAVCLIGLVDDLEDLLVDFVDLAVGLQEAVTVSH